MGFEKGDLIKLYNGKYAIITQILNDKEVMLIISDGQITPIKFKINRIEPCFQYDDKGEYDGNMSYINFSKANFAGLLNEKIS